ncbi:MAG TPA: tRNA pseudouridine(55) synthase TruB [Mycobacteriales bacterium]|jgi:tRNA pseudouridine55 synthase|nr:tRNA pseudouridine(55) synthase TruB [Mycobacteriales bacterium]
MSGLLVLDKPAGWTSHDVVARVRRLARTKRVGHAGTLDPMATGVLVLGVEKATRLLGHLTLHDKRYDATLRLGVTTSTDDAEGEVVATADASGVTEEAVRAAARAFTGELAQVPPAVSAISVDGVRSYTRARRGEDVVLAPRQVVVHAFDVLAVRGADVDVRVHCGSGTYVRALARDLGTALGVGAHLTALRRTASGPYALPAPTLDDLERDGVAAHLVPIAAAVRAAFPSVVVGGDDARRVASGVRLRLDGTPPGVVGVFDEAGDVLALATGDDGPLRYLAVFSGGDVTVGTHTSTSTDTPNGVVTNRE